jgi:hypothetical protein
MNDATRLYMVSHYDNPRWWNLSYLEQHSRMSLVVDVWQPTFHQMERLIAMRLEQEQKDGESHRHPFLLPTHPRGGVGRVARGSNVYPEGYVRILLPLTRKECVATARTLYVLLDALVYLPSHVENILCEEYNPDADKVQLLSAKTMIPNGNSCEFARASMNASIAPCVADWAHENVSAWKDRVEETGRRVYTRITGQCWERHQFGVVVYPTRGFSLNTFGNACGVDAEHGTVTGDGLEFSSHNMDGLSQQLSILAGLARLLRCFEESA